MQNGETLRAICRDEEMPSRTTVLRWAEDIEAFRDQYARAREALQDYWADEIVEIAEDGSNDWMDRETRDGRIERVFDQESFQRSRLRIDARKWLMSKLAPRRYGDKITQEIQGSEGGPAILQVVTKEPK